MSNIQHPNWYCSHCKKCDDGSHICDVGHDVDRCPDDCPDEDFDLSIIDSNYLIPDYKE